MYLVEQDPEYIHAWAPSDHSLSQGPLFGAACVRGREENLLSRRRAGAPSARQAQRCRTPPLPKPQLLRLDS